MTLRKKTIYFIVAALSIHCLLLLLFNIQSNKRDLYQKLNSYKDLKNLKTLFMGYSIVERSIDVSIIDSAYSLAFYGENNKLNYYKLQWIINNKYEKPTYIVLPCDIITFIKNIHYEYTNKPFYYGITPLSEIGSLQENKIFSYYDYIKIKLFPYIYWQQAMGLTNVNRNKKSKNKFSEITIDQRKKGVNSFIKNAVITSNKQAIFYDKSLFYLKQTIILCQTHKIKMVFVKYPFTKPFLNEFQKNSGDSLFINRESENMINHENIPILDFEKIYLNHEELFFDSHHLNEKGKSEFSKILKLKLDSLYKVY